MTMGIYSRVPYQAPGRGRAVGDDVYEAHLSNVFLVVEPSKIIFLI